MNFKATINYANPSSSGLLYTQQCLTNAFKKEPFTEQCHNGTVPVKFEDKSHNIYNVGTAFVMLDYPNVVIEGTIDTSKLPSRIQKAIKDSVTSSTLCFAASKYFDVEKNCNIVTNLDCYSVLLSNNTLPSPNTFEIVKPTKAESDMTTDNDIVVE